jgi:hypothetical protein
MPHIEAVKRQATPKALLLFLAAALLLPDRALAWGERLSGAPTPTLPKKTQRLAVASLISSCRVFLRKCRMCASSSKA